jgi:signal transduction histidine kinase
MIKRIDQHAALGMRERAETLHGQLTIAGRPGSTLLNARIPIKAPTES